MKLNNQQIVELYEGLSSLRAPDMQSLPVTIGYSIIKDTKMLETFYLAATNVRDSIAMKYGDAQGDGVFHIPEENMDKVQAELKELWGIENTIKLDLIPLSALAACSLPLDSLYKIYPLIDGEA